MSIRAERMNNSNCNDAEQADLNTACLDTGNIAAEKVFGEEVERLIKVWHIACDAGHGICLGPASLQGSCMALDSVASAGLPLALRAH